MWLVLPLSNLQYCRRGISLLIDDRDLNLYRVRLAIHRLGKFSRAYRTVGTALSKDGVDLVFESSQPIKRRAPTSSYALLNFPNDTSIQYFVPAAAARPAFGADLDRIYSSKFSTIW